VLFSGSKERVEKAAAAFKERVAKASGTLNLEDSSEPTTQLEFIGMKFDFNNKTIDLAQKNRAKVNAMQINNTMSISAAYVRELGARCKVGELLLGDEVPQAQAI